MERHNSCINSKAVIDYVEARDPSLVAPLLEGLESSLVGISDIRAFLTDPNNWISSDILIQLYNNAKRLHQNEEVVFDIGFESVAKKRLGYIQRILFFAFQNHGRTVKRLQSLNDKFNRNKRVELKELNRDGAVVRLQWFDGIPMTRDFCLMNKGIYTAVPVVWNQPPCSLIENKCYFQGDAYCEYQIHWQRKKSFKRFLLRTLAPWHLAKTTIEEIERDKALLREKYAEVQGLNLRLQSQLNQMVGLQESSGAILSTLKIENLMNVILQKLIAVSGLDRAAIFLLDDEKQDLYMAHAVGAERSSLDPVAGYRVPLDRKSNIIARVAKTGKPELVDDVKQSQINPENKLIRRFKPKAFIALPLNVRGHVVGVLIGDQKKVGHQTLSSEKEFLTSFSNQIAIAINNARLYRELEKSERKYRELVENANEGIWKIDENGQITFANQRLAAILGYASVIGCNVRSLVAQNSKNVLTRLLLQNMKGNVAQDEAELVCQGGDTISAIVSSVPIREGGQYHGSFAMVTDITEKKRMESQILHQQKMESIGTMAGGMAHDFNNILTGILGYTNLLKMRLQNQHDLQRYAEIIETSSMRAADLVRQLLQFSRGTSPKDIEIVYMNRVIRETVQLFESSHKKDIEVHVQLQNGLSPVDGNPTQVQQALLNLCLNARDAMPNGGQIHITTTTVGITANSPAMGAGLQIANGKYAKVEVSDTGVGIPPENIDRIFDPFFTTKEVGKGSGLGLAMVYGILKNAGGYVFVESAPGKGTTFKLLFRVAQAQSKRNIHMRLTPGIGGQETILLVDDEPLVRDLGVDLLSGYGYKVLLAADGYEALDIYTQTRDEIDLVILDLLMPRLDGFETFKRIKELNPNQKIIICSGYGAEEQQSYGAIAEPEAFVDKPFNPEAIVRTVREVMDGDTSTAGGAN
jgi:PAS domain S-box-containing protein